MYLLDKWRYDELERIAADFIEDYGIASYPISPIGLLRRMGIAVKTYNEITDVKARAIAAKASPDAFQIASDRHDVKETTVYYDSHHDIPRTRTSTAHELAHILCGHPSHDEPYESEAKYLASYLLAPAPLIIALKAFDVFAVMDLFGVSRECAEIRVDNAQKRMTFGGDWQEHEIRILESCREWSGGVCLQSA